MAPSTVAASATVRHMGPVTSWLWAIGTTPERLVSPRVGLIPTRALWEEGQTIDPSVSVPRAPAARLAAAAVPDPELEPHGLWSSTYGLRHWPARPDQPLEDWVERKLAHSDRLVLPRMTAPARRSRRMTKASRGTSAPSRASDPAVVSIRSRVAKLSLTRIGMPCRARGGGPGAARGPARPRSPGRPG